MEKYVQDLVNDEKENSYKYKQENQTMEGNGPKRIDENLEPDVDMYAMLFTTTMYPEYIYMIKQKIE